MSAIFTGQTGKMLINSIKCCQIWKLHNNLIMQLYDLILNRTRNWIYRSESGPAWNEVYAIHSNEIISFQK